MKTHDSIKEFLNCDEVEAPLSDFEYEVLNSRPFKLLCWHYDQLRKAHSELRSEFDSVKRDYEHHTHGTGNE